MNKNVKLYNLIFPIWVLWLIPVTWIVVLPANLLIDLVVTVLTLRFMKETDTWKKAKSVIFKTWVFGFIADFIGTAFMLLSSLLDFDMNSEFGKWWYHNITNPVSYSPFDSIFAVIWITVCVIITSSFIYLFNYKISYRKLDLDKNQKRKLALSLAIFTAPYLFYLPTSWFY